MSSEKQNARCAFCAGTGWRQYDENHAQVCEHCCKHHKGWWELTEHHAGYVAGADNACCRAGCGTMRRDLPNVKMSLAATDSRSPDVQSSALALAHCSARDRFEAWITAPPFEKDIARSPHDQTKFAWPGQYRSYEVQLAWEAWCEAAGIDPFAADAMLRERKQGGQL